MHAELVAGRIRKYQFEEYEKVHGFNWSPHSIILNEKVQLEAASSIMYDWGHCLVCDGLCQDTLGRTFKAFQQARITDTSYGEMKDYAKRFTLPKCHDLDEDRLLGATSARNNLKSSDFSCYASEFLKLAPIIERYFKVVVQARNQCTTAVDCLIKILFVLCLLQATKTGSVSPDTLDTGIDEFMVAFILAFGFECVKPKHHYTLHFPELLRRFGFLLTTFTHERKHRVVKRHTRDRKNLTSWELSAIEDITSQQLWELSERVPASERTSKPSSLALATLRELFPTTPCSDFTLHAGVSCNGGQFSPGDVVTFIVENGLHVGEMIATVGTGNDDLESLFSIVSVWVPIGEIDVCGWRSYKPETQQVRKVPAASIDSVLIHCMDDAVCMVYLPYELRG